MLKKLKIQNLILVETAEIQFTSGMNILTGETGAGKSAILSAIRLISGARSEVDLIRKDCDMAIIEAEIAASQDTLLIRRELHRSGKSRCFIDEEQVSLTILKEKVGTWIELVDQSSSQTLCSEEVQRSLLDTFANLKEKAALFKLSFEEEKLYEKQLKELCSKEAETAIEWAKKDLELIETVDWKKGEEELLAQEHLLLTHAQELKEKTGASAVALEEISPLLKKLSHSLDLGVKLDPKLQELSSSIKGASIELEEARRSLESYADKIEHDPGRLVEVEMRIGTIENLKRRFGSSWEFIEEKKSKLQLEIDHFHHQKAEIILLQKKLSDLSLKNTILCEELSSSRSRKALSFAQEITEELKSLNLPHAQFKIHIEKKSVSASGSDLIQFLFSANPGVPPLPIDACASGGELSRLLLALKTTLAEKEGLSSLIFDEIDSNVGGQTASILGAKLKKLSDKRQVICVTHFVQVAKFAQTHFGVYKKEHLDHARTTIELLSPIQKEEEYSRMLGLNHDAKDAELCPAPHQRTGVL